MNFVHSLLDISISDTTGILQVVLAVFSIIVDIVLAFLAAKINNRSKKTHINQVIAVTEKDDEQSQESSQQQPKEIEDKVKKQLSKIGKYNKNGLSVMKFIKLFKDICSEAQTIKILRSCKGCGVLWDGPLSVDTIVTIDLDKIDSLVKRITDII